MRLSTQQIQENLPAISASGPVGQLRVYAGPSDSLFPAPRITAALRFGTPQRRSFLGDAVMPSFQRDGWKVLVITEDSSHLLVIDTERGLQEPRKEGKWTASTSEFSMARFGFQFGVDRELSERFADQAFRLAVGSARRAEMAVRLDIENRKALLLSTASLWPAAHRSNEAGTPWDGAGGDAKASLDAAVDQIKAAHPGFTQRDMGLALSEAAWDALRRDTAWLAARVVAGPITVPTLAEAEAYLGFQPGSVIVGDATVKVGSTVQSMWGETAIVYLRTNPAELDTEFGEVVFALHHVLGGAAFPPYFEERTTTDWFPFDERGLPVVHDYTAAFLLHDMKA